MMDINEHSIFQPLKGNRLSYCILEASLYGILIGSSTRFFWKPNQDQEIIKDARLFYTGKELYRTSIEKAGNDRSMYVG